MPQILTDEEADLIAAAREVARGHGGQLVTVEHIAVALIERAPGIRRYWRALGIDDDRAVRGLASVPHKVGGHAGREHRFYEAQSDKMGITPEVRALLKARAEARQANGGSVPDGQMASILLTFIEDPLPGSPVLQPAGQAKQLDATPKTGLDELYRHGRDLTGLADLSLLDPLIGREPEMRLLIRVLSRKNKRNPLLVGEAGVGKTALVEGLAQDISQRGILSDARVIAIDLAALLANTRYRGEFEARVRTIIEEVRAAARRTILFIDEFHLVMRAGAAEGGLDLGSLMLSGMARGDLSVIGATTPTHRRLQMSDGGPLLRRMQVIEVTEPSSAESVRILQGLRSAYEEFHKVAITDDALELAAELGSRSGRLPDAALDLIDDACAAVALTAGSSRVDARQVEASSRDRAGHQWQPLTDQAQS